MIIWKNPPTLEGLNASGRNGLPEHLGMKFTEIGDDYMTATMPVDHRTVQPMRLLHGGASVAFAETLGSVASMFCLTDLATQSVVGGGNQCQSSQFCQRRRNRDGNSAPHQGRASPPRLGNQDSSF